MAADTKTNLQMRVEAEHGACQGKLDLAKRAKELAMTQFMIPFMKCAKTKPVTAKPLKVC